MMNGMKKTGVLALVHLLVSTGYGQQDPVYSQYLNNPVLINPAYTGLNNRLNAVAGYRLQWAGFDGSPTTLNFSTHSSLVQNKAGAGLVVVEDRIGDARVTEAGATFAYKIEVSKERYLSFGMQSGIIQYRNNLFRLDPKDPGDPFISFINETKFNLGAGLMLMSERFLVGLSLPRLMPTRINPDGTRDIEVYNRTLYLLGAYVVYLTPAVRLKPSVLLRTAANTPLSADLNFNLNLEGNYTLGVFTRNFGVYGFLAQMNVKHYRFGYVFEVPVQNSVGARFTSHEFSVGMALSALSFHSRMKSNF